MAFVNEYASDEDIERYGLKEIWDRYHPRWKGDYFAGNRLAFTIDRERDIFLMTVGQGTGELGNRTMFLLWWNGIDIRFDLDLVEGSSRKIHANPFCRVWELAYINVPDTLAEKKSQIIARIKQAVKAFGYRGAKQQIPNTIVTFNF